MIAFIHLEKTAGSSFKNVLRRSFGRKHCDAVASNEPRVLTDKDIYHAIRMYPGLLSLCSHHFQDSIHKLTLKLNYVTFLRDPVKRTASHYQHMVRDLEKGRLKEIPELEDWINNDGQNFQIRQLFGSEDLDQAMAIVKDNFMFVGLTEEYKESLDMFAAICPWPVNTLLEKRNIAPDTTVKNKLLNDSSIRRMIEDHTQIDQALYERVKTEIFPAQNALAEKYADRVKSRKQPNHYLESRLYTNLVYRPSLRLLGSSAN